MNHATRLALYRKIEVDRATRVIALVTGERVGLQTQIAADGIAPFVSVLDTIGPTKKLSLILETNGGQTSAAWRLIKLIRSFCDELEVIIPTKAMSAGTLMSLGANRILMTKQAALGPIDPSLDNHPLSPTHTTGSGAKLPVAVSAEAVRGYIDEVKRDISDPAALAVVWTNLANQIHPIVLGQVFRLGVQIRSMASDLIKTQVADEARQASIIQLLCSDSGSHDYTIDRRHAAEIGLQVEKPSADLYGSLTKIVNSYNEELETLKPVSASTILANRPSASYKFIRGLIESADASYGFVSEGKFVVNAGPPISVDDTRESEGWRKLT